MKFPIAITGAASGIGAATLALLRERGHEVISIDLRNADVDADLSTPEGRMAMAECVASRAPQGLAAVIACAGDSNVEVPARVVSVNYFGAVATLSLLRPLLQRAGPGRGVVVASTAALLDADPLTVEACLAGDEVRARSAALNAPGKSYASSKRAVALWMRRVAVSADWAGRGLALNAVAPGTVRTPMTAPFLGSEEGREMLRHATPVATADYGDPDDLAEVLAFLATIKTGYLLGNILFADGGTNVLLRPDTI
jgi:NAD(P)-dependent dehydrogenase (short-subunit alcohol dehydrogenase family)